MAYNAIETLADDGSKPSLLASLIAQFAPPDDEFEVELGASKLKFKAVRSYDEIKDLQERAAKFVANAAKGKMPFAVPANNESLVSAFVLSDTSLEPKLTTKDCCELALKAGYIFKALVDGWNVHQLAPQQQAEADEIEKLKND